MFQEGPDKALQFEVDDSLDAISRLEQYHTTDFHLQRFVLARDLYDIAVECGVEDTVTRLLPILPRFAADSEVVVRLGTAQNLSKLCGYLFEGVEDVPQSQEYLLQSFVPLALQLASDEKEQVAEAGLVSLKSLAERVSDVAERIQHIVRPLCSLAGREERREHNRVSCALLLLELSPILGNPIVVDEILPRIVEMCDDVSIFVRKTIAEHMGKLCAIVGPTVTEDKLLPIFINFAHDDIWVVRKSVVKTLPEISRCVTDRCRARILEGVCDLFRKDASRWVKLERHRQLGPFIATFPEGEVSDSLVSEYTNMVFQNDMVYNASVSADLYQFCAYSFPAVVQAVGPQRWFQVERAYSELVRNQTFQVRKSLASSLHIVARVATNPASEPTICSAFEYYLEDLDEIKSVMSDHFADFLASLSPPVRKKQIKLILGLPSQAIAWRIRFQIAAQGVRLSELCEEPDHPENEPAMRLAVLQVLLDLLNDSLSVIRKMVAKIVGELFELYELVHDDVCIAVLQERIVKLATGKWNRRQLYIVCCEHMVKKIDKTTFESLYQMPLIQMQEDPVSNIRLMLIDLFKKVLKMPEYRASEELRAALDHAIIVEERMMLQEEEEQSRGDGPASAATPDDEVEEDDVIVEEDEESIDSSPQDPLDSDA